jgi:DNA-directed RNA polymerase specialized sigma24 family protein
VNTLMAQTGSNGGEGLNPDAFARFLRWLAEDMELALKRYSVIRKKLVNFFVRKGCSDPHELFDKTVDRVVLKIAAGGEYTNREAFCYGVARNIWLEDQRKPKPDSLVPDNIPSPPDDERELLEQKLKCLEGCMEELSPRSRDLITRYHQYQGRQKIECRRELAKEHRGENALRIKVLRIRKSLHDCVNACVAGSAQ